MLVSTLLSKKGSIDASLLVCMETDQPYWVFVKAKFKIIKEGLKPVLYTGMALGNPKMKTSSTSTQTCEDVLPDSVSISMKKTPLTRTKLPSLVAGSGYSAS